MIPRNRLNKRTLPFYYAETETPNRPAGCGTWSLFFAGVLVYLILAILNSHAITFAPSPPPSHDSAHKHSIVGSPSISASLIDHVLCTSHSPACGTGDSLYTSGVQYGIDPAYALAFFRHESGYGRYGVARTTHGLGNIRCTPGYACQAGFRAYSSWQAGYQDWYKLMVVYGRAGKQTVETILPTYAPASENNTSAYIQAVLGSVATYRQEGNT